MNDVRATIWRGFWLKEGPGWICQCACGAHAYHATHEDALLDANRHVGLWHR